MNSINTNMSALSAQQNMQKQNAELDQAMTRLSSGLRINSAADDAAGSAIASKMEAQVRSLDVAIRNSYDAISMTQTAEGALGEMENILQRVRELSVQASNSTLSSSDRTMIQSEVDALVKEIDNIAENTHFNNVKLLDGTNTDVTFQIGVNATDGLKVNLQKSDSTALGLSGATGVNTLSSSRMVKTDYSASANTIAAADIKINGFDAFSADFDTDLSASATNTAKGIADAINLNTGVHGAEVNAFNTFTTEAMGSFNMAAVFTLNSETVALASSYTELVGNINEAVSGVTAVLNQDNTITISNTTGDDILVNGGADVGFGGSSVVYTGMLDIKNLDGTGVQIEAGSVTNGYTSGAGTIADLHAIGFNEFSTAGVLETDTVSGTALSANQMKINDVLIGGSLSGSANHVAAAINEKTAQHGVTASAKSEIQITFNYAANPVDASAFGINGQTVDVTSATGANDIVTAVNNASIGDIRAEANADGTVKFSSASGVDIIVGNSENDFLVSATDIHGKSITDGFADGGFSHDAFLSDVTAVAISNQAIDTTGSNKIGEVVNSRIMVTFGAAANYSGASNIGITVTGTDSSGNAITENIDFANATSTINDQQFGSTVFHTVTAIANRGVPLAVGSFSVGLGGNVDTDKLRLSAAGVAAGAQTLISGTTSNINGFVSVTHSISTGIATNYTIVGTGFDGEAISDVIAFGTSNGTTLSSAELFKNITSITTDQATSANSNLVQIGLTTFKDDALFSSAAATAAGTLTLTDTDEDTFKENLGGAVVTISGNAGDYTGTDAVKFTVTGTNQFGSTITEDITLNVNDGEVHGNKKFDSITSIVTDKVLQAAGAKVGLSLAGDRVEAKGNMSLVNGDSSPIKIEAVGDDTTAALADAAAVDVILEKMGVKNQSQSFEVTGEGVSVGTEAQATASLAKIDAALDNLSLFRSSFGAVENRIDASINNATTLKINTEAAKSRIQDADFAAETSKMTKSQILSQAATSMLAQANASKQNLLALLQG
jgi:flagellin